MTQNTRSELDRKSPGEWIVQHFLFEKLMRPQSWEFRLQLSPESVMLKGQPASSVRCQSITADCCRLMKQRERLCRGVYTARSTQMQKRTD